MRARAIAVARPAPIAAALSLAASVGLWLSAMAPRLASEALFGPICSGHGSALAPHCPACYAAAGFLALAIGFGGASMRRV